MFFQLELSKSQSKIQPHARLYPPLYGQARLHLVVKDVFNHFQWQNYKESKGGTSPSPQSLNSEEKL